MSFIKNYLFINFLIRFICSKKILLFVLYLVSLWSGDGGGLLKLNWQNFVQIILQTFREERPSKIKKSFDFIWILEFCTLWTFFYLLCLSSWAELDYFETVCKIAQTDDGDDDELDLWDLVDLSSKVPGVSMYSDLGWSSYFHYYYYCCCYCYCF